MTRRALSRLLAAMLVLGAGVIVISGLRVFAPTERTKAEAASIPVPPITAPGYAYAENPRSSSSFPTELLLVKSRSGELSAFEIPIKLGRHTLPDFKWWKPEYLCRSFGPDLAAAELRCTVTQASEWIRTNARWSIAGRAITPGFDNMVKAEGHELRGRFVLGPL